MGVITYDISAPVTRNRLSVGLRIIYAIPHLIVAQVWGYLAQIVTVIQWFIVLFTGKRNEGIWNIQYGWLGYYGRVMGYVDLLYDDPYPAFGTDASSSPVSSSLTYEAEANRLTNALRIIWAIPAAIIAGLISIAATVLLVISWFAIVITGKQPSGMYEFILKSVRYLLRVQSYTLLMTDTYPKYE